MLIHDGDMIVVKLFNVIQQSQVAATTAEESLKAQRGSGKPTLPAPLLVNEKKKGKLKPNALGQGKTGKTPSLHSADLFYVILVRCRWGG
jgi:hypothetical protein